MSVSETSKQAYEGILPELGERQKLVLDGLKTLNMANNKMISMFLKIPINTVTPIMVELRDMKLVTFSHEAECPWTTRNSQFWKVTKWGEKLSDIIDNPKLSRLIYRGYITESGLDTTVFKAVSRDIDSKDWHNVEIVSTFNKETGLPELKSICDCYHWNNTLNREEDCKHIEDLKNKLIKDGEL